MVWMEEEGREGRQRSKAKEKGKRGEGKGTAEGVITRKKFWKEENIKKLE
jgi:hypothetical protein